MSCDNTLMSSDNTVKNKLELFFIVQLFPLGPFSLYISQYTMYNIYKAKQQLTQIISTRFTELDDDAQ